MLLDAHCSPGRAVPLLLHSYDCNEPPHVHVRRDRNEAKFWLEPVEIEREGGFSGHELREIRDIIIGNLDKMQEKWYEHCGG